MILPSLPDECFSYILTFLDRKSLYKCLFVNRYYCKVSIPIIWRNPFRSTPFENSSLVINTLLSCLDEDEISSLIPLIPCAINFNNQSPLFEYGKFIRKFYHKRCVDHIKIWLESSSERTSHINQDCIIQKLVDVIYHTIMRQGLNLHELNFSDYIPNISIFTTYKSGITNLRSVVIELRNNTQQETVEFLSILSKFCNGIINFELYVSESYGSTFELPLDIIKSQPLERMKFNSYDIDQYYMIDFVEMLHALQFRSETLKELEFNHIKFQGIDFSFISMLGCLERLKFKFCDDFTYDYYEALSKKKFCLKELEVLFSLAQYLEYHSRLRDIMEELFNFLCGETLLKLTSIVTPNIVKAIKNYCPNIYFLRIKILSGESLDLIIPLICELSSLKILNIEINDDIDYLILVKMLGDYLTFVEYLHWHFYMDSCNTNLSIFEYFTKNCKANLIKWNVILRYEASFIKYLRCVDDYQKIHNSLKVLGMDRSGDLSNEELEIIYSLENQGVNIVPHHELNEIFGTSFFI